MIIEKLGPVRGIWAVRCETKQQLFNGLIIRKLNNFNDVAILLASRNQLHMLYIMLKSLQMTNLSLSCYYINGQPLFRLEVLTAKTTEQSSSWSPEGLPIIKSTDFPWKCYYVIKEVIMICEPRRAWALIACSRARVLAPLECSWRITH